MIKKATLPLLALIAVMTFASCGLFSKSHKSNIADSHNSRNALDWEGTYQGVLPCADCEGMQTTIRLKDESQYKIQTKYLGMKEKNIWSGSGKFTWDNAGQVITLANGKKYFVGENQLTQLDQSGNKISGTLADHYILHKMDGQLKETYWKLVNLKGNAVKVDSTFIREPYLILRDEKNRISGNGGCNQIMGFYKLEADDQISFSRMASTLMACPNMKVEQQYLKILQEADRYALDGDKLTLSKGDHVLATFKSVYFN